MRTPQGVVDWAHANPTNPYSGGPNWNNDCVQFVWGSGGFPTGNSAATANMARAKTIANGHALDPTASPPAGWFVYFDGPTTAGHMGMSVGGGKFLSATVYESDPTFGPNLGVMRISDYDAIPGVTYKGATPWFINATLDLSAAAGGGGTPISPYQENDDMPQHVQVIAGGPAGFVAPGDYILTASGLEGATSLALGFIHKNPASYTYVCWGNEAAAIDTTVRSAFLRNLAGITGGGGGGLTPAQDAKLTAIPSSDPATVDEAELGAALTAAVNLINGHADENTTAIIAKVNGLSLSHG